MKKKPSSLARSDTHDQLAILRRLDIDPEDVKASPRVSDILCRCFGASEKRFPRQQVLNFLAASPSPAAQIFLQQYRKIAKVDAKRLSLEAICVFARVSPLEILGALVAAARGLKRAEGALKAIMAHPEVIDATVETAKLPGMAGVADRRMLHESGVIGFLPAKKGSNIAISFGATPEKEEDQQPDEDEAWSIAFPRISSRLEEWSEERRQLGDGN